MTTLIVNIDDEKSQKVVKALLDSLELSYNFDDKPNNLLDSLNQINNKNRVSAHKFLGKISAKDVALMEKAIGDGCEQVHPDDWK